MRSMLEDLSGAILGARQIFAELVFSPGVIATTLPFASLPTAVNCCVAPMANVSGFGVTVIVKSGPGDIHLAAPVFSEYWGRSSDEATRKVRSAMDAWIEAQGSAE